VFHHSRKWLRLRANILRIERPRLLSVADAATALNASEAYVRRLLARQRLYGTKVGSVWAIFPEDVEAFKRTRRPAGRPRKLVAIAAETASDMAGERAHAGTHRKLRKRGRRAK
jgi:excisionase family DNA binding protein